MIAAVKFCTKAGAAGDENGAINAYQTLINQSKVVAIVGPTLSQQAFAADPIADNLPLAMGVMFLSATPGVNDPDKATNK